VSSRREAERLVLQGRVRVNGEVIEDLGTKVHPGKDRVELDGREVRRAQARWILFNKPRGVLTTRSDPQGRKTVYEVLPGEMRGLRYVGRLDLDTEGLLLLTNRGDALHLLTHPSTEVEREYEAQVRGRPLAGTLRQLREGIDLEDGLARAAEIEVIGTAKDRTTLTLVLLEGRKREVRRMLEAVGHPVIRLRRTRFGPLRLGDLRVGTWRELTEAEIRILENAVRREETP
jgi:pseudouridine synthase